jgi:hypothetical protein
VGGSPNSDEGHTLWYSLYVHTLCQLSRVLFMGLLPYSSSKANSLSIHITQSPTKIKGNSGNQKAETRIDDVWTAGLVNRSRNYSKPPNRSDWVDTLVWFSSLWKYLCPWSQSHNVLQRKTNTFSWEGKVHHCTCI